MRLAPMPQVPHARETARAESAVPRTRHLSQWKENSMRRIITGMLTGAAMLGMVSVSQAQFGFGLFDVNRDTFVNPVEFGTGLDRGGLFDSDGLFDFFDADDDGL